MNEQEWMVFVNHYWETLSWWEMVKLFRKHQPRGVFFGLNAMACRNQLLMNIALAVKLCEFIQKTYQINGKAAKTLDELKSLYDREETKNRDKLHFPDCGIAVFRNKILAHPLNHVKKMQGKEYEIDLKWDTVEETLTTIKQFANEVEEHFSQRNNWDFATYKEEVAGLEASFGDVISSMDDAANYHKVRREIMLKGGKATVSCSWRPSDEIVVDG
jgi:hypothetical protein